MAGLLKRLLAIFGRPQTKASAAAPVAAAPPAPAPAMTLSLTSPLRHSAGRTSSGPPPSVTTLSLVQADLLAQAEAHVRLCVEDDTPFNAFALAKLVGGETLPLVVSNEFESEQEAFTQLLFELFALRDAGRLEAVVIARPMPKAFVGAPDSVVFDVEEPLYDRVLATLFYRWAGNAWAFEDKVLKAAPGRMFADFKSPPES